MVKSCAAISCTNRFVRGCNISFHKFPKHSKDSTLRDQWIQAISREAVGTKRRWIPGDHDYVCSNHFREEDFILSKHAQHKLLRPGALPSLNLGKPEKKITVRTTQTSQAAVAFDQHIDIEPEQEPEEGSAAVSEDHAYCTDIVTLKRKYDNLSVQHEKLRQDFNNAKRREKRCRVTLEAMLAKTKEIQALSDDAHSMLDAYKAGEFSGGRGTFSEELVKKKHDFTRGGT
ncbi:THAP domain-containing protein 1-like isoform 3-T5 [Pholidichthys leucotaenia]